MKKVLAGCLIVIAIAIVGFGVAAFYAYRAMKPVIDNASNYMDKAREVARLGEEIKIRTPYEEPKNGELTSSQVERFLAVQTRVRSDLGDRWAEIEKKSADLKAKASGKRQDWTLAEFTSVFSEIGNIWVEARRSQVNAINIQRFSEEEYEWVRARVYEAAGVELVGGMDLSKIEGLARENASKQGVDIPKMDLPEVPAANIALVKPHIAKIKEWMPMAALGL
ncbi:MAG: hypothetical protein K2Y23_02260 [Cyanobacteria bacterium]|nr:hypothetical protein [Cyanobacteriota bacterium]